MMIITNPLKHVSLSYPSQPCTYEFSTPDLNRVAQTEFHTHSTAEQKAEKIHAIAQKLLIPIRVSLYLITHVMQPLPGANKDHPWAREAIRIASLIGLLIVVLPSIIFTLLIALPVHAYSHRKRYLLGYIKSETEQKEQHESLHVRTHNVALVHRFMSVMNDLRNEQQRAHELTSWILTYKDQPDVICFQEVFSEDTTRILCENLKHSYNIIHSVAPHVSGYNSGLVIASKYPIVKVSYRRFGNCIGEELMATKGLLRAVIEKGDGRYVNIYNTHLIALLDKERANARTEQLRNIVQWMKEDHVLDATSPQKQQMSLLLGDLNISKTTIWGEQNDLDDASFQVINDNFEDLFLRDHDRLGQRTGGNRRFEDDLLPEARASWYTGPHAKKPLGLRIKEWFERKLHRFTPPIMTPGIEVENPVTWGRHNWYEHQQATSARFDYILLPKAESEKISGKAELRRIALPAPLESAASDHLALDAVIS